MPKDGAMAFLVGGLYVLDADLWATLKGSVSVIGGVCGSDYAHRNLFPLKTNVRLSRR